MRKYSMLGLVAAGLLFSGSAFAAGDAAKGASIFIKCKMCHSDVEGKDLLGPTLFGVVGRTAGTKAGYSYSAGVKALGYPWDEAKLDAWLTNPKAVVAGTKMTFAGLPNAQDRADVIAYLATKK